MVTGEKEMKLKMRGLLKWIASSLRSSQRRNKIVSARRRSQRSSPFLGVILALFAVSTVYASTPQEINNIRNSSHTLKRRAPVSRRSVIAGQVTLVTGSLKENLSHIAARYGWKKVVWLPETDFQWVGKVTMPKRDIYKVFTRVLRGYPLQAVFYKGNHVLVIRPRNV